MIEYNLTQITPPAIEPLSLDEVKHYLRLDDLTDISKDIYLSILITVAREFCENYQNRAYITQTFEMALQGFPRYNSNKVLGHYEGSVIEIPKGKLQSIDSFLYKDSSGILTTLNPSIDYVVSNRGILGRVCPPFGRVYPIAILYPLDPVVIRFTCGYGVDASFVPRRARQAIILLVSHWYENRSVINDLRGVNPEEISFAVSALLTQDKIVMV